MTSTADTAGLGRAGGRLLRRRAGRVSSVLGLTVLFGAGMTGQAFSEPGNGRDQGGGEPPAKITICHATGAEANPYDELTISVNGLHGHDGHEGDLIPAPEGGCPGPDRERHLVTICHATNSETNPYDLLTLPESALNGHDGHEGDLIPAPEGGCPVPVTTTTTVPPATTTTVAPTTTTTVAPTTTTTTTIPPTTTTIPPTTTTIPPTTTTIPPTTTTVPVTTTTVAPTTTTVPVTTTTVAGTTTTGGGSATTTGGGTTSQPAVLGLTLEGTGGGSATGTAAPGVTSTVLGAHFERTGGTLPRTGSGLTGLATFGLGLLVLGALLKLSARPAPATVRVAAERH